MADVRPIDGNKILNNPMFHTWKKRDLVEAIKDAPTLDYAPVVHAHWEYRNRECSVCSNCSSEAITWFDDCACEDVPVITQFCPNCGARMDEPTT